MHWQYVHNIGASSRTFENLQGDLPGDDCLDLQLQNKNKSYIT